MEFVVWSPWPYSHRSAGMRALFVLANELRERGHDVKIAKAYELSWSSDEIPFEKFRFWNGESNPIHIYPEGVSGNPSGQDKVVRWILAFTPHRFPVEDLIVTWSPEFIDAPILQVEVVEPFFVDNGSERTKNLFWIGKGRLTPGWLQTIDKKYSQITHRWPATRQDLAKELQQAKELVLFDPMTCLYEEAKRCGCPVRMMVEKIDVKYNPQPEQIDNFVDLAKEKFQ